MESKNSRKLKEKKGNREEIECSRKKPGKKHKEKNTKEKSRKGKGERKRTRGRE
jgi:hypothetical protein